MPLISSAEHRLGRWLRRAARDERGQLFPLLGLIIVISVFSMAYVADLGFLYVERATVRNVVDRATLAAVQELPNASAAAQAALDWAADNGYQNDPDDATSPTIRVEVDGEEPWVNGAQTADPPADLACPRAGYCVRVTMTAPHSWMFGAMLSLSAATLTSSAVSEKVERDRDIIFVLDRSGSISPVFVGTKNKMLRFGQSPLLFPVATGDRVGLVSMLSASTGVLHVPYTWTISEGSLPDGLVLAVNSGRITGTPTAVGTSTFTVRVTDGAGTTAEQELTITVRAPEAALEMGTETLPDVGVGEWYQQPVTGIDGTPPYSGWSITDGSLPSGMVLGGSTGLITGAASGSGTWTFTVRVTDSTSATHEHSLSITVHTRGTPLTVTTLALPDATFDTGTGVGAPYSQQLAARNGPLATAGFGPSSSTPADCQTGTPQPAALNQLEHILCQLPLDSGSQVAPPLRHAIDEFIARGRADADWHIIVLSDGAFTDSSQSLIDAQVARAIDPVNSSNVSLNHPIRIHTVGLLNNPAGGINANITRLANMAAATGGGYYAAPSAGGSDPAAHVGTQLDSLARALNIQLTE